MGDGAERLVTEGGREGRELKSKKVRERWAVGGGRQVVECPTVRNGLAFYTFRRAGSIDWLAHGP